ncbi:MAG: hypothetical protein KIT68_11420, partial [Phycisphaeraceae bacterium]|nr:hypothetical protein [Phycisphaeraceae bacterium]
MKPMSWVVGLAAALAATYASAGDPPPSPSCDETGRWVPLLPTGSTAADRTATSGVIESVAGQPPARSVRWGLTPQAAANFVLPTSPPGFQAFGSACWYTLALYERVDGGDRYSPVRLPPGVPLGFRLGINLLAGPSPGDFSPPSPTIGGGSLCLVPPGAGGASAWWNANGRPTLDGVVDLVTGVPLVRSVDLELPLDGATFRLTRTRSNHRMLREDQSDMGMDAPDRWWDWVGQGWMAGENPILLIDAATPDLIGDGARTTWLWLDAHHSIPFQMVYHGPSGGGPSITYEAPARFRARMTHNGVAQEPQAGRFWAVRPTQFDVWLYDGQVHYTFVAVNEDVPPNRWNTNSLSTVVQENSPDPNWEAASYHDRPFTRNQLLQAGVSPERLQNHSPFAWFLNPGFGVPHYGLCVRVADQYGHEVRIKHAPSARWTLDHPGTSCVEIWQDAAARGQIQYIKLVSQGQVKWTLLYAHRRFAADGWIAQPGSGERYRDLFDALPEATRRVLLEQFGASAIDRIYVFPGDVPDATLGPAVLVCHSTETPGLTGGVDPLTDYNANRPSGAAALPTDWTHRVRYHYLPDDEGRPVSPPILAMTTVASSGPGAPAGAPASERRTVYVHRRIDPNEPGGDRAFRRLPWLECVYTEDD